MISKINFYSSIFLKLHLLLKKVEFTFKINQEELFIIKVLFKVHKSVVNEFQYVRLLKSMLK